MALASFENALRLNPECDAARIYAGICSARLGRFAQALEYLNHDEDEERPNALACEAKGDVFFHREDFARAAHEYRLCGHGAEMSPLVACKLGACEVRQGQCADGLARIQAAVERNPRAAELYYIWVAAAMLCGDVGAAAKVAEQRLLIGQPPVDSFVVAAGLQTRLNRWNHAASILLQGMQQHPSNERLRREWKLAADRAGASE